LLCAGTGFAKLAARSGAEVIPGFALWLPEERKYVLRFYPPIEITGDAERDIFENTQRFAKVIEEIIRKHPEQGVWIHARWKTRPAGEPKLYEFLS